jgi:hypothetical protein
LKEIIKKAEENKAQEKRPEIFWANVLGAPLNQSGSKAKDLMNENPEHASAWKGRVLMQIECVETEKPLVKVQRIEDDQIRAAGGFMRNRAYQVICEVG